FPELAPQEFRPWVNENDARSENMSVDEYAAKTATVCKEGLQSQGIAPDRIQALRGAADFAIYTPGSESGLPLNVVGSLRAPALPPLRRHLRGRGRAPGIRGALRSPRRRSRPRLRARRRLRRPRLPDGPPRRRAVRADVGADHARVLLPCRRAGHHPPTRRPSRARRLPQS